MDLELETRVLAVEVEVLGGQFGLVGGGFNGYQGSYPGSRQFAGFGGTNGYNQYSQLGNQAYNVLGQGQGAGLFGGQGGGQYYPNNGYFGGVGGNGGFNQYQYNPYASTGGAYPFGGLSQGGFGGAGGFGGFNQGGFNGAAYSPGGQGFQGQLGIRNFGFINQGFGNPTFRPQSCSSGSAAGISSLPGTIQVGTGLDVGSRGFGGSYPSASGQQYIVGNGIGQPAFIGGGVMSGVSPGDFGAPPFGGGLYSPGGIPGGLYRHQLSPSNSLFGLGSPRSPYDFPRTLSSPSPSPITGSRPGVSSSSKGSSLNRFSYSPNSRERLYRYTSDES